jgi:serine/threonine protein kinase
MDIEKTRPRVAAIVVGDFRLGRELGSGGFGTVFEAVHTKTGMTYAVKRLSPGTDPERFRKEALYPAQAASRSLHVLNTHSIIEEPSGTFYIATDFMRHGDLKSFVAMHGPLTVDAALELSAGIAKGLAAIHEDGIVHLDLKPENVLMDRKDDVWIPKIADFGLARSTASQVQNNALSIAYASPEHFDTRLERTWAADMFSFGMVLFELLTGTKACGDATSQIEYFGWLTRAVPPPAPSSLRLELQNRTDVDHIVSQLLVFDAAKSRMNAAAAVRALTDARHRNVATADTPTTSSPQPPATPPAQKERGLVQAPVSSPQPAARRSESANRSRMLLGSLVAIVVVAAAGGWALVRRPGTADVSSGITAYQHGDYAAAYRLLIDPARSGNTEAERVIGLIYADGSGVPKDVKEGRLWLDKAADKDDAEAKCGLAELQASGGFGQPNLPEARRLYSDASTGHACGHRGLGQLMIGAPSPQGTFDEGLRHLEQAAAMGDAKAVDAIARLQQEWRLPPLVAGAWQPVTGKDRRDETARLAAEKTLDAARGADLRRMRRVPLEFYDNTSLFELEVGLSGGEVGVLAYLRRPQGAVLVNGQSAELNQLNRTAPLRIDTPQRAVAYLKFYQAGAVQGRDGSLFRVIDDPTELPWLPVAPQPLRTSVSAMVTPLNVTRSGTGGWQATGFVMFNRAIFAAMFEINESGLVTAKPKQETEPLPVALERYDPSGVRVSVLPDKTVAAPPASAQASTS